MTTIIGLSGSLRQSSYNTALLRAAAELAPAGTEISVMTMEGIPLYNGDREEREGIPAAVEALKRAVSDASGLLLASPEYNASIPGPLKNAVDWMTRPPKDIARVFHGRPAALIGATPGGRGTVLSQAAWLPVLRQLSMRPFFGKSIFVAGADDLFNDEMRLSDVALRDRLKDFIAAFVEFIESAT